MKTKHIVIIFLLSLIAGFFLGRVSLKTKEKTKYIKEKTITSSVNIPQPEREIIPYKPLLPLTYVFLKDTVFEKVDTAKIIQEYIAERQYNFTLFDNHFGKLNLKPTLQYNRLVNFDYSFTPITKVKYEAPTFIPFISSSFTTFGTAGIGGGFFYKNWGIEYNYLYNSFNLQSGHLLSLKMRF